MKWSKLVVIASVAGSWIALTNCSPTPSGLDAGESSALTDASTTESPAGADATSVEKTPEGNSAAPVPTDKTALLQFLKDGKYSSWAKESKVHKTTAPHESGVRVFVNSLLENSLKAGNKEHPVGSASVKELYQADLKSPAGYAVMVKVKAGSGGDTWYWYEILTSSGERVVADGTGVGLCTGCHSSGVDFFRTTFPFL